MASPKLKRKPTTAGSSSEESTPERKPLTLVEVRRIVYDYMMIPGNGIHIKTSIREVGANRLTDMDPKMYREFLSLIKSRCEL